MENGRLCSSLLVDEGPQSGRCRGGIKATRALEPLSHEQSQIMSWSRGIPTILYVGAEPYPGDKFENVHYAVTRRSIFSFATASKVETGVTYPSFRYIFIILPSAAPSMAFTVVYAIRQCYT